MKRKSRNLRALSWILSVTMCATIATDTMVVFAQESTQPASTAPEEELADVDELSAYLQDLLDLEEVEAIVTEPVYEVEQDTAQQSEISLFSVQSEEDDETQYEIAEVEDHELYLRKEDGSTNYYSFSEDVKYQDEDGNTQYKETSIVDQPESTLLSEGYEYTNGTNDVRLNFSTDVQKGVLSTYEEMQYNLFPEISGVSETAVIGVLQQEDIETGTRYQFVYDNVYGENTSLSFIPQLNGVKEEIILEEYTGQNRFAFILNAYGNTVQLSEDETSIEIIDDESNVLTTFDPVFAYDAEGGEYFDEIHYTDDCSYEIEALEDETYRMTVVVSEDFLTAETTVYPVIIDPTTSKISNSADTAIYSATAHKANSYSSENTACFGRTTTYGNGRVLVKFTIPSAIKTGAAITSAEYWVRETTGRTASTYVRPYVVTSSWSNSTTWNTKPSYDTASGMTRKNINSNSSDGGASKYWYKFELKSAVSKWVRGTTNNGVIFVSEEEGATNYNWRAFATKEYSDSSFRPYVIINYTNDTTAPTLTDVTGNPTSWTSDDVKLKVTGATDGTGAGLHATPYSFSTTKGSYSWQASATSSAITTNKTIYVYLRDKLGNIALRKTVTVNKIDKTAPTLTEVTSEIIDNQVTLTIVGATDASSGLHTKPYSFSTTKGSYSWQASATSTAFNANTTVYVYLRDALGNSKLAKTMTINGVDNTAPTISDIDFQQSDSGYTVTVTAEDTSGVTGYSFDGGETWQTEQEKTYEICPDSIEIQVKDAYDNVASVTYVVPKTPVIYVDNSLYSVVIPALDETSALTLSYKIDDGEWLEYEESFAVNPKQDTTVYAKSINADGNESAVVQIEVKAQVGVYATSFSDMSYDSLGTTIDFSRSYESDTNNWYFSFENTLLNLTKQIVSDDTVVAFEDPAVKVLSAGDGSKTYFLKQADGTYRNENPQLALTVTETESAITINGTTYSFDENGRLVSEKDVNDNEITYAWQTSEDVITGLTITDAVERTATVTYANGRPTAIAAPGNHTVTYGWTDGQLTSVTNGNDVTVSYSYENDRLTDDGSQTISYNAQGRLSSITARNNSAVSYSYDDENNQVTMTTTADEVSTYTYDEHLWITSETDSADTTTSYTYHVGNGLLASETVDGDTTSYYYDENQNLTKKSYADDTTEEYEYNENQWVAVYKNTEDQWTTYIYDAKGNILQEKNWTKGAVEEENVATLAGSSVQIFDEGQMQLTSIVEEDDKDIVDITNYTYYSNGNVQTRSYEERKETTDDEGTVTATVELVSQNAYTYDTNGYGATIQTTDYTTENNTNTTTSYTYDIVGQLTREESAEGKVNTYSYDAIGQKTSETLDGKTNSYTYDDRSRMTSYHEADASNPHRYVYADNGNLTKEINKDNEEINYTYDNVGNMTSQAFYGYTFDYNISGSVTEAKVGTQSLVSYSYTNDAKKNLTQTTFGNGQTVQYSYSGDNVSAITYSGDDSARFEYTYEDDTLTEVIDHENDTKLVITTNKTELQTSEGTVLYSYETKEEDATEPESFNGVIEVFGENTYTVVNGNGFDRFILGDNSLHRTYTNNADGQITNQSIKLTTATDDAITSTYTYDDDGQLTALQHQASQTIGYTYTYDTNGNIVTAVKNGETVAYTYDGNQQLIRVNDEVNSKTTTYSYDSRGNLQTASEYAYTTRELAAATKTDTYTYGDSNWADKMTKFNDDIVEYDSVGNPTSYDGYTYVWEGGRQLKRMTKGGSTIEYKYDADGIRTQKTVDGVTTQYYTKDGTIVGQSDGTDTLYFRYDSAGELFGFNVNGTEYLYLTNLQGDVMAITDTAGVIKVQYEYDAWGKVLSVTGELASTLGQQNPMRYRGYYLDNETGYYYLQSRYYDTNWKRFLNADTSEYLSKSDTSSEANLFTYCKNHVIAMRDSNGKAWQLVAVYKVMQVVIGCMIIWLTVKIFVTMYKEHTQNKSKKNWDKHTKPRAGRSSEKKKQSKSWKPRK